MDANSVLINLWGQSIVNTAVTTNASLGGRARAAEVYPRKLILEILRGIADTADANCLKDRDENTFQTVSAFYSGFNDVDSKHYKPTIDYNFAERDAIFAVQQATCSTKYTTRENRRRPTP